jgi:hypothetical protein
MNAKSLVHVVGAEVDGVQPCARCGTELWHVSSVSQLPLPVGAKVCLSGNVVEFVGHNPSSREFEFCGLLLKTIHGIRPGHDHA